MSEQPPLASPSGPDPSFEPYSAPAWGDVAGETGTEPTRMAPPGPAPTASFGAAPPPPAAGAHGAPGTPGGPAAGEAGWSPYPVAPQGQNPYQVHQQFVTYGAPTHQLATTSLVLGIIGIAGILLTPIFLITFLSAACSPFAIWLGIKARREIRANPRQYGGEGVATAGLVTGIVGLVLGVIGLLLIVALFAFFAAIFSAA